MINNWDWGYSEFWETTVLSFQPSINAGTAPCITASSRWDYDYPCKNYPLENICMV